MTAPAMRLLVSVRDLDEALEAAAAGADFIDLKEPSHGALGGLPVETVRAVVEGLRRQGVRVPISATIGDRSMAAPADILDAVAAVGACGVDYVKVGIERGPGAREVVDALAGCGWPVVPVFIVDQGLDEARVAQACALRNGSRAAFAALMVDTADKHAGSLFERVGVSDLRRLVAAVRQSGSMIGLAGALRLAQLETLASLQPDFAGFRSAVCADGRTGRLEAGRVRELVARLAASPPLVMPA